MDSGQPTPRQRVGADATIRLAVRAGEYLLWVVTESLFNADSESGWTVADFWQFRDGDSVTITNRWADLPVWFELHPLEVGGRAVFEMTKKLSEGDRPTDRTDGPNVWRVRAGDRLAWVAISPRTCEVRQVYDFRNCVLVLGESNRREIEVFGAPDDDPTTQITEGMRAGFLAAARLGMPRTVSTEWLFGT